MLNLEQLNHSVGVHQLAQSKKNAELDNNIIEIRKYQREMETKIDRLERSSHQHEVEEKSISLWEWISLRMKK
ncbi:hypothetical protein LCGC14_1360960 [marine sediment metagenome]|uniref:Uncharacterized protein n=1 Tax=marine sediment metagenome TaxID=412755 RepID=A0A0F9NAF4_9ZZZZ